MSNNAKTSVDNILPQMQTLSLNISLNNKAITIQGTEIESWELQITLPSVSTRGLVPPELLGSNSATSGSDSVTKEYEKSNYSRSKLTLESLFAVIVTISAII